MILGRLRREGLKHDEKKLLDRIFRSLIEKKNHGAAADPEQSETEPKVIILKRQRR